jgi:hypothetical protein
MTRALQAAVWVMYWTALMMVQSLVIAGLFALVGYHAPEGVAFALAFPMAAVAGYVV